MKRACVDACFLINLYDERESDHNKALTIFENLFDAPSCSMLIPWPVLYESVSTRLVRDTKKINKLSTHWKHLRSHDSLILLDDSAYRDQSIDECFQETDRDPSHYRSLSLVDRVIRLMLADESMKIDYLLTFNLRDFVDICEGRRIEIHCGSK